MSRVRRAAPKNHAARRTWYAKIRAEVFAAYGGKCACCGESEPAFLAIDHVNNDGAAHRASIGTSVYHWLRRSGYPEGFQVLCWNCNRAKYALGRCPHQPAP